MLKKILISAAVLVGGFALYVALQPAEGRVVRSVTISAPAEEIFPHVNNFRNWDAWSPWAKLDPHAKLTFEGPVSGNGAVFAWSGNNEVGVGKMTIIDSRPNELVKIRLDFEKPFEGTSTTDFTFKPDGSNTLVTWDMRGERPFLVRAMCILFNADKMIGGQFEKGLASLKAIAEKAS